MVLLRRGFAGASIAWAVALPLASLAASRPAAPSVVYLLTLTVYAIGSVICHQRPERSFYLWSHQLPVCARCTGIYVGAALAVLVNAVRGGRLVPPQGGDASTLVMSAVDGRALAAGTRARRDTRTILVMAALPAMATLVYEWTTGVTPSNWIRAASGLCLGVGVAVLIQREVN